MDYDNVSFNELDVCGECNMNDSDPCKKRREMEWRIMRTGHSN